MVVVILLAGMPAIGQSPEWIFHRLVVVPDRKMTNPIVAIAFCALLLSIISLILTVQQGRRTKQVDIQNGFHERFDRLQEYRTRLLLRGASTLPTPESDFEAQIFFDRFWSLQFDQYVAWQQGFVDDYVYRFWVFARWRQLRDGGNRHWVLNGMTPRTTFMKVNDSWAREPANRLGRASYVGDFLAMFAALLEAQDESQVDGILQGKARNPMTYL